VAPLEPWERVLIADPEAYERAQYLRVMLAWEAGSRRDTRAGR